MDQSLKLDDNQDPTIKTNCKSSTTSDSEGSPPHEIKKWGCKGKLVPSYYFQPVAAIDSGKLRMTNVSVYSTTPWKEANFISRTIVNFFKDSNTPQAPSTNKTLNIINLSQKPKNLKGCPPLPIVITDATANIGGNTISFYLNGLTSVNAVEMDELTCEILKHNLSVYQLPTQNVHCCDYLSIYKQFVQDVVFLDPPWGGPDYKKATLLDLYLGENPSVNIIDICAQLFEENKVKMIVLKLPINYNLPGLMSRLPKKSFLTHKIYRHQYHSYNVVYIWG